MTTPTREYLEEFVERLRPLLPHHWWQQIHREAMAAAGGKRSSPKVWAPSLLEALGLGALSPDALGKASAEALVVVHDRLHLLARRDGHDLPLSRAHALVVAEMDRRGVTHEPRSHLDYIVKAPFDLGELADPPFVAGLSDAALRRVHAFLHQQWRMQAADFPRVVKGVTLPHPHAAWVACGYRTGVVSPRLQQSGEWTAVMEPSEQTGQAQVWALARFGTPRTISRAEFDHLRDRHRVTDSERARLWGRHEQFQFAEIAEVLPFDGTLLVPLPKAADVASSAFRLPDEVPLAAPFEPVRAQALPTRGVYLVPPHGEWLARGVKTAMVKSRPFAGLDRPHIIVSAERAYGVVEFAAPEEIDLAGFRRAADAHQVTEEERKRWWPDAQRLYLYRTKTVRPFAQPVKVDVPQGAQTFLARVDLPAETHYAGVAKQSIEDLLHAHEVVAAEMHRRRLTPMNERDPMSEAWRAFTERVGKEGLDLPSLPEQVMIVPDFVSVVGSAVHNIARAQDVDVLFRAERIKDGRFALHAEAVELPVRKVISPGKDKDLHYIASPQGPHADFLPVYHLMLVRSSHRRPVAIEKALDNVRLKFIGTGAMSFKETGRNEAGLLLAHLGHKVLIDGGPQAIEREVLTEPRPDVTIWLTTDEDGEQMPALREIARKQGWSEPKVASHAMPGLRIEPFRVEHTNHPSYGYEVRAYGRTVIYAPEFWKPPVERLKNADLAIVEAAAWEEPIRFAEGVGGHAAALETIKAAQQAGAKRILLTHIGKPTARALDDGARLPPGVEVARDGQEIVYHEKAAIAPGRRYTVQKPSMAGTTEYFSVGELWDEWAKERAGKNTLLLGSPKIDGFRTTISKQGDRVQVWFEDSAEDRSEQLPDIVAAMKRLGRDVVLEGELTIRRPGGKPVARVQTATFLAGKLPAEDAFPYISLYDALYVGEDIHDRPFTERLRLLQQASRGLPDRLFDVLEQRPVRSRGDLDRVGKWAAAQPISEGLFIREAEAPYEFGATERAAKWKTVFRIKARVLEARRKENGYSYLCGVERGAMDYSNLDASDKYVTLGATFVTDVRASEGDTLEVEVEEIITDGTLTWGKPTVVGIDRTRGAYSAGQLVNLAERGHVLKTVVEKAADLREEGEDETRGGKVTAFWSQRWPDLVAKGAGGFVLHAHWRGLSEEETRLSHEDLLKTTHSVHFDLRLEGPQGLWGFTIFAGPAANSRGRKGGAKIADLRADEKMQGTFKLEQPKVWLRVGRPAPYVSEPEGVGATSQKYAKFFALDYGTYTLTFAREHAFEIILRGERGVIRGRYQVMFAPVGGRRIWLISRPEDQDAIYADDHDLGAVLRELKAKGQRWLFWRDDLDAPLRKIDVRAAHPEEIAKAMFVPIAKVDEEKRLIYGVVLEPDVVDTQGDFATAEAIEQAAHDFLARYRIIGEQHRKAARPTEIVENYITPHDLRLGSQEVRKGAWVMVVRVLADSLWADVKGGLYTGFSIGGWGEGKPARAPVEKRELLPV